MKVLLQIDCLLLPLNKNSSELPFKQAFSDRIPKGVEYRLSALDGKGNGVKQRDFASTL